jgi:hypothetical protein
MSNKPVPLASKAPGFPPIAARHATLYSLSTNDVISWADRLGTKAANKDAAITAILLKEYGNEAYEEWAKRGLAGDPGLTRRGQPAPGNIRILTMKG